MMKQFDNAVRRQVYSIEQMLSEMLPIVKKSACDLVEDVNKPSRILLTGCGDCYCAALSAKEYIAQWLQTPVEVVTSLELARHYPSFALDTGTLVVLMSKSGSAARVVEAAQRMNHYTVPTVAITAKSNSMLAQQAKYLLELPIPSFESAPGVRSYTAMLMGVYLLAAALAEKCGTGGITLEQCVSGIAKVAKVSAEQLPKWDRTALKLAQEYSEARSAEFIGSGSDLGSAWYSQAKVYETVGLPASYVDCEDWFHIHYFAAHRANTLTVIYDHEASKSATRTRELILKLKMMEMPFALVTDDQSLNADFLFLTPKVDEWLTPFCQYAVGPLVAAYLAKLNNRLFNCGFVGPWARNAEAPSTTNSSIQIV